MPIAYHPRHFLRVLLARQGSAIPRALLRSASLLPVAMLAQACWYFDWLHENTANVLTPFGVLVGLMSSFRLNDAYRKWHDASHLILQLHARSRTIMSLLFAYCGDGVCTEELEPRFERIRRLLVLAAVMIKKHVRGERDFDDDLRSGLVTEEEAAFLKTEVVTVSKHDEKKDVWPWRNRPAFVFDELHRETVQLLRDKHFGFPSPSFTGSITASVSAMSDLFEEFEHLGMTLLPLPYAQLHRLVAVAFLLLLPFGVSHSVGHLNVLFCFCVNVVYFALDETASIMETPLARDDVSQVAFEKMLRRLEKHTAAQLGRYLGKPSLNFDLYPETRKTDASGLLVKGSSRNLLSDRTIYDMDEVKTRIRRQTATAQSLRSGTLLPEVTPPQPPVQVQPV